MPEGKAEQGRGGMRRCGAASGGAGRHAAERHGRTALGGIEESDLARHMRLADPGRLTGAVRAIHDGTCFILHSGDDLVGLLSRASRGDSGRCTVRMSLPREFEGRGADGKAPRGGGFEIIFVERREDGGRGSEDRAELTGRTREWLARARPGRRLRMLNLGLGAAIFAAMSAAFLVAMSPPLSYVFAAGALAPAGIMLARAASGHV